MAIWYAIIGAFTNQVIACVFKRFAARNAPEPPHVILVVVLTGVATNGNRPTMVAEPGRDSGVFTPPACAAGGRPR